MAPAPFVDMLLPDALQARTENNAATFSSSGNALLDFFYQVVESSSCSEVHDLLNKVRLLSTPASACVELPTSYQ